MSGPRSERERVEDLLEQLRLERESWRPFWHDLARHITPMRARFFAHEFNRGDRRNQAIIDNTATFAAGILASGMMSGITNPARPWFRLTTPDPDVAQSEPVKQWLSAVEQRMFTILARSNFYNEMQVGYGDLGVFGTAAVLIEEDDDDIIRCQAFPCGSYFLGNDAYGRVRVFAREFTMSVAALVEKFGEDAPFSTATKSLIQERQWRTQVQVAHLICGNPYHAPSKAMSRDKAFVSYYWEAGSGRMANGPERSTDFLRVAGYDEFPVLGMRWEVSADDPYGTSCPGMVSLGDIRQLQLGERRVMQAIEKQIFPPVQAPVAMRNQQMSFAANGVNFVPVAGQPVQPLYEVRANVGDLEAKQQQVRARIQQAFFADLFLMNFFDQRADRATATEIAERREEKLLVLGPVLERLNKDGLNPAIDRIFNVMARKGLIPEPPPELQGMDLKVEYLSLMAQAQKLVGVGGMERFASTVANLAQAAPDLNDVPNWEAWGQRYGDMLGLDPDVINSPEEVAAIRAGRAEAQAAQAQAEQAKLQADAMAKLSSAKTDEPNLLNEMLSRAGGGMPNPAAVMPS